MINYVCKYTPLELLAGFGEDCALCDPAPDDPAAADPLIHRNVCSFSRVLIQSRIEDHAAPLVLTDCCDSIRRACDVLRAQGQGVFMLSLPRRADGCGCQLYKKQLIDFINEYSVFSGKTFDPEKFRAAFTQDPVPEGPYIAVMGARAGGGLLESVASASPLPVRNLTCTGERHLSSPPPGEDIDALMEWYAAQLLALPACMRMADVSSRRDLFLDPNLKGIVYNTVKFCDFYGFEYAGLKDALNIPILKIETDYAGDGGGQLGTRLEAFFESLEAPPRRESAGDGASSATGGPKSGRYVAGIDSGSVSTNAVLLDESGKIAAFAVIPTGVRIADSARRAFEDALSKAGVSESQVAFTVSTGYGRTGIRIGRMEVTEITCHARGARYINPAVRTVIDIGGQDSKVIRLDERGGVRDFVMNDKCAAGTGCFLEMMAKALELDIAGMSALGLDWKEDIVISSMCSVFAQSEVVSLIADGKRLEDIVHGLNRSVASKIAALAGKSGLEREYMMTGGVAKNAGVVRAVEERLGGAVIVPPEPEICGALGAALIAAEQLSGAKD